ncbi:MAG: hypothetical protein JWM14_2380 [Chitinophagaceae bacterium]|nr:hypothetical protein [Chitinophagaceae bacterium]
MPAEEIIPEILHIYQPSQKLIPGLVYWHGEDYPSFAETLDRALQQIKNTPLHQALQVSVHLHQVNASDTPIEEWKTFYCVEKRQEYTSEYLLMKRQGYRFLWRCLFLLWICLTAAYAFDKLNILGDYSQMLGRETFFFLGWVILWKPIEMIVFEPWSIKHQLKLIKKLEQAKISVTTL